MLQVIPLGSSAWARSSSLLRQLNLYTDHIDSAEGLFDVLLDVIEALLAAGPGGTRTDETKGGGCDEIRDGANASELQATVKRQALEIEMLKAERNEISAKNEMLRGVLDALSTKAAALDNSALDITTSVPSVLDASRTMIATCPDASRTSAPSQSDLNRMERSLKLDCIAGSPSTPCTTPFFTPSANSPNTSNTSPGLWKSMVDIGNALERTWTTFPPETRPPLDSTSLMPSYQSSEEETNQDELASPLTRFAGVGRKRKASDLGLVVDPICKRLKRTTCEQPPEVDANDVVLISDGHDDASDDASDDDDFSQNGESDDNGSGHENDMGLGSAVHPEYADKQTRRKLRRDDSDAHYQDGDYCRLSDVLLGDSQQTAEGSVRQKGESEQSTARTSEASADEPEGQQEHITSPCAIASSIPPLSDVLVEDGRASRTSESPYEDCPPSVRTSTTESEPDETQPDENQSGHEHQRLKRRILASYEKYGLRVRLIFSYTPRIYDPRSVDMRSSHKNRSVLDARSLTRLRALVEDVTRFVPTNDKTSSIEKEARILGQICLDKPDKPGKTSDTNLEAVVLGLHWRSECSRDEARMLKFECYSVLAVLRSVNAEEVRIGRKLNALVSPLTFSSTTRYHASSTGTK